MWLLLMCEVSLAVIAAVTAAAMQKIPQASLRVKYNNDTAVQLPLNDQTHRLTCLWVVLKCSPIQINIGSILSTAITIRLWCRAPLHTINHIQSIAFSQCITRSIPPVTIPRHCWLIVVAVLSTTQTVNTLVNAQCKL